MKKNKTLNGVGLGLRPEYYQDLLHKQSLSMPQWLEITSENFFGDGGKPLYYLDQIKEKYPLAMHGVSLSIGSEDKINFAYLKKLKKLQKRINPLIVSDHLCWTGVEQENLHDLLPVSFNIEKMEKIIQKIKIIQDYLEYQITLENVSSYFEYTASKITEWDFLNALSNESGCGILLDVNNVYVSSINHQFDALTYIKNFKKTQIKQVHLAGHTERIIEDKKTFLIDTHDQPVCEEVWNLYRETINHFGYLPTMIERDDNMPDFSELLLELDIIRKIKKESHE